MTGTSAVQNLCEIRAVSAEKAGYYLDCALSNRSVDAQVSFSLLREIYKIFYNPRELYFHSALQGRDSHFLFTLHVYQHSVSSEAQPRTSPVLLGGRSRLHLIDFGCCERTKTLGGAITIAGLGNVILGILNGQRHLPFKESKVTQLLREVLGSVSCQVRLGSVSCVMTPVSVWECHMSCPDIINVAMSTSNLSTETCFRQKLKCNDSFIIQSIQSCDSANSPHNIRQIPQSVTILLFRNHKKLDSPVN